MQIIAKEASLKPYILRVRGSELWESEFLDVLQELGNLEDSIVFLDECETIFSSRDMLATYGSVMAETKKACIGHFLQWANGLAQLKKRRHIFNCVKWLVKK